MIDLKAPLMRFSELPKHSRLRIVIIDLDEAIVYKLKFIKLKIFFPDDKKKRECYVIFPKWKLLNALLRIPVKKKKFVGKRNILIEFEKQDLGKIEILEYDRYV